MNIRATSRALGLRTEASARHEKGLAPELAMAGARRAAALVKEWAGGTVHSEWIDVYPRPQQPIRVTLDPRRVDEVLGVHVPLDEAQAILRRLGFHLRVLDDGRWDVLPPVFRLDVQIPEDIVEEIGRIHGIEKIPPTLPGRRRRSWHPTRPRHPHWEIREVLLGAGFDETVTPALVGRKLLERLGLAGDARSVINPMSDELDTMRTSLLPSLLGVAALNQNRGAIRADLFELARVYSGSDAQGLAREPLRLTAVARVGGTAAAGREGFLRLKSVLDRLAADLAAGPVEYRPLADHLYHPGRTASFSAGGKTLGVVGELHPATLAAFDLDGRAVAFDIDADALVAAAGERKAKELPRFPAVTRDLAVVVAESVPAAALLAAIRAAGGDLLESVTAFDEYRSEQLGAGVRSVAFALTFRSPERTLTDSEVDQQLTDIRKRLETEHGAKSR